MKISSYAKINLGLHVVGKRTDGFHNIETIFHYINLFDEIAISRSHSIGISCTDSSIPTDQRNLCWQAAEAVQKACGITEGVQIDIKKNIPVGAGLGGGSSNAAAILRTMPALFQTSIEQDVMNKIALRLGSDVPFFLGIDSAYGEGRGEILSAISLALPYWIVVVNPGVHVSTPWAYKILSEKYHGRFPERKKLKESFGHAADIRALQNDFEHVVFSAFPVIASIKTSLQNAGALHALMSGSGSSVFGLFEKEPEARRAASLCSRTNFVHVTEPNFSLHNHE